MFRINFSLVDERFKCFLKFIEIFFWQFFLLVFFILLPIFIFILLGFLVILFIIIGLLGFLLFLIWGFFLCIGLSHAVYHILVCTNSCDKIITCWFHWTLHVRFAHCSYQDDIPLLNDNKLSLSTFMRHSCSRLKSLSSIKISLTIWLFEWPKMSLWSCWKTKF